MIGLFFKKTITLLTISAVALMGSFGVISHHPTQPPVAKHHCGNFLPVEYRELIICVSADYYQENGVRKPVGISEAKRILQKTNSIFPTPEIVDQIYKQADIKLPPRPLPPGPQMTGVAYSIRHNNIINEQLAQFDTTKKLIAGHKKDIVGTNASGSRVAIYGWHRINGIPIQPYSTVHGAEYADYSHGLRLVSKRAWLNGVPVDLRDYL